MDTPTGRPTAPWRPHVRITAATGMASLLDSAAIVSVGLGLPLWRSAHDLDVWTVGALSASLTVSIALGALVGGRLADHTARDRVFTATVVLYAVGAAVIAASGDPAWLVAGIVALGLASGADLPASLAVLTARAPAAVRGRLVASTHVLWTVGVLLTTAAGLAVSGLGETGIRLVFATLAGLAATTAALRSSYLGSAPRPDPVPRPPRTGVGSAPTTGRRSLVALVRDPLVLAPLLLTGGYYTLYTLVSNTFGSFKTYVLVVVCGTSQTTATLISLLTGLVGLAGTVVFALVADSPWRRRLFPFGIGGYVVTLALVALSGGTALPVIVAALLVQNMSFPFVGDALYKVRTQEVFPADLRATAQGATICVARLGAAAFALVTPALLESDPRLLLACLCAAVLAVGVIGRFVLRAQTGADVTSPDVARPG